MSEWERIAGERAAAAASERSKQPPWSLRRIRSGVYWCRAERLKEGVEARYVFVRWDRAYAAREKIGRRLWSMSLLVLIDRKTIGRRRWGRLFGSLRNAREEAARFWTSQGSYYTTPAWSEKE